jgi:hypothetical protein
MAKKISLPAVGGRPLPEHQGLPAEVVALRESSVITLAAHGLLTSDQVAAAFRFKNVWADWVQLRSRHTQFEKVDFGGDAYMSSALMTVEREEDARHELQRCRDILGAHGFQLLIRVCGEGYNIKEMLPTRRGRDTATDMLRLHLDSLAALWRDR